MKHYNRVIPRDLFNEANLLKCVGKLVLDIHDGKINFLTFDHDGEPFNIIQDDSGFTYVANVNFYNLNGDLIPHQRTVNARDNYPLELIVNEENYYAYDEKGNFMPSPLIFGEAA